MRNQQNLVSAEENHHTLKSSSTSHDISDLITIDLFFDIFSRLPQKTIARFRCVSKLWSSILSRPDFIDLIMKISAARPRLFFTVYTRKWRRFFSSPQPINQGVNLPLLAVEHPTRFPATLMDLDINPPVHGLLCTKAVGKKGGCNVMVYNPSTGQSVILPPWRGNHTLSHAKSVRTYLGYDPVKRQSKVLCINDWKGENHQVLTLRTGELSWRKIQCSLPAHDPVGDSDAGVCINGVVYYIAEKKGRWFSQMIVCFDVMSEKLTFIDPALGMNATLYSVLINYTGKLGVLTSEDHRGFSGTLELWVLDGVKEHKWLKKIHVLPSLWKNLVANHDTVLQTVGMTGSGDFVFSHSGLSDPFYVFFYNVETNTFKRVEIQGIGPVTSKRIYTFIDHIEDMRLIAK